MVLNKTGSDWNKDTICIVFKNDWVTGCVMAIKFIGLMCAQTNTVNKSLEVGKRRASALLSEIANRHQKQDTASIQILY